MARRQAAPKVKGVRVPPDINLVHMRDLVGLYVGGKLVAQEPEIDAARVLELLGVPFDAFHLGNEKNTWVQQGILPLRFRHVPLEMSDDEDY